MIYLLTISIYQHTIMNIIASNLLTQREEKRLTQAYIAFKSGMSQPNYSDIERGKTRPSIEQLKTFAEILNVTVDELISDVKKEKSANNQPVASHGEFEHSELVRTLEEKDSYIRTLESQLADLLKKSG